MQESVFDALENKLAHDMLKKALMEIQDNVTTDIEKNKTHFSEEIKKTLASFKEDLEKNVAQEIDHKISALLAQHFQDISSQVRANFHDMFSPVLERTKEDMQRLHMQGENTISSWKDMVGQYKSLWTQPFILMFLACMFTGMATSLVSSYYLIKEDRKNLQAYENNLSWIAKYIEKKEAEALAKSPKSAIKAINNKPKNQMKKTPQ